MVSEALRIQRRSETPVPRRTSLRASRLGSGLSFLKAGKKGWDVPTYDFFDHDRFVMVRTSLDIGPAQLFGHIALFERWLTKYHLDGDISGVDDRRIEIAAGWIPPEVSKERAGHFVVAMRDALLIYDEEGRTLVRGWPKHAPDFVKKRLSRQTTADSGHRAADNGGQRRPVAPREERSREEKRNPPPTPSARAPKTRAKAEPVRSEEEEQVFLLAQARGIGVAPEIAKAVSLDRWRKIDAAAEFGDLGNGWRVESCRRSRDGKPIAWPDDFDHETDEERIARIRRELGQSNGSEKHG